MTGAEEASEELAAARQVARPYVLLIRTLLEGHATPAEFAAEFETTWDAQTGAVPDAAYEPINHLAGVVAAHDPEFAAAGDADFVGDQEVVAAARVALDQLRAALG